MTYSNNCVELVKQFEGCVLKAYNDGTGVYTIGYGHTQGVKKGDYITQVKALQYLKSDLNTAYEKVVRYNAIYNFTQNQIDALTSFAYNVGNISGLTRNGRCTISEISDRLLLYVYAGGKKLEGLVRRRKAEKKLFDMPDSVKASKSSNNSIFTVGKNYKVVPKVGLNVRKSASTNGKIVKTYKCGTVFTCLAVKKDSSNNIWIKTPSGYVCAYYASTKTYYVR